MTFLGATFRGFDGEKIVARVLSRKFLVFAVFKPKFGSKMDHFHRFYRRKMAKVNNFFPGVFLS